VKARHLLVRSSVARVGLVDSVGRGSSSVVGISRPLAVPVEPMAVAVAVAVSKAETLSRPVSGRHGVSRVDSHSSVERLSGPLAVAIEPMAVAVSKAESLSRPVGGRHSMSRVDSHSSVEGLSRPLAIVATIVEAGVETGDLLVRSAKAGVGLADGVLGSVLVAVDVVAVLKSGNGTVGSIGISAPLAVAGVELSPLLERSGSTRVRLADGVAGGKLMSVHVVAVLKSGGEGNSITDSISDGSIGAPLADTVAVGSVDSGAGEEAGGRPGGEAWATVVIS